MYIKDLNTNTILNFNESPTENGYYIYTNSSFIPEKDTTYELNVIYQSQIYQAFAKKISTVQIDMIEKGDAVLIEGDETEIKVTITEDQSTENFYLFDFDFDLYLTVEDRFLANNFTFSYFYEEMVAGQEVTIKIFGISERHYNYMNAVIEQSNPQGGGVFQTPPANIRGNIKNITNPENFALGFFNIADANRVNFKIPED